MWVSTHWFMPCGMSEKVTKPILLAHKGTQKEILKVSDHAGNIEIILDFFLSPYIHLQLLTIIALQLLP